MGGASWGWVGGFVAGGLVVAGFLVGGIGGARLVQDSVVVPEVVFLGVSHRLVEGLGAEVVVGGGEGEAFGGGLAGEGLGVAHESAGYALPAGLGSDEEVLQKPDGAHGDG